MSRRSTKPDLDEHIIGFIGSLFWYPTSLLPPRIRWYIGGALGAVLYILASQRRKIVKRNLELCFPGQSRAQRNRTALETFRCAGRGLFSWGLGFFADTARIERELTWYGRETLEPYLQSRNPVILLCPHFVTPVLALRAIAELSPITCMYEAPVNPTFNLAYKRAMEGTKSPYGWLNRMYRNRATHPVKLVWSRASMRPVFEAMKKGEPFFYLPDQNAKREGHQVFAPFFGVQAATYSSLTRFVKYRNARIFLCFVIELQGGAGYEFHTRLLPQDFIRGNLEEDAARLNLEIENLVRRVPEQYFWLHRRFKTRPPGEPGIY